MPKVLNINLLAALLALVLIVAVGCSYDGDIKAESTTKPADGAIRDHYGKFINVNTDVSGGGTSNLNHDAMKRDLDNFLLK
jgi:hypothetical protein